MRVPVAVGLILSIAGLSAAPVRAEEPRSAPAQDRAREAVVQALAAGGDVPGQARNLVKLAWPTGKRDEEISARARLELAHFGDKSFEALREALNTVKPDYTEEVMATTLNAKRSARVDMARGYLASVIDALWVGNRGAKVLALEALDEEPNLLAVGPAIDSAIDDPALTQRVIETLGRMRFPQARIYLDKIMMEGPRDLRPVAASSLAQIGGAALGPLKNALKAPDREARLLAARSLLPAATEYDVGAIYEYLEKHGDDDPALAKALRTIADNIEKAIAARDAKAAAASPKDF